MAIRIHTAPHSSLELIKYSFVTSLKPIQPLPAYNMISYSAMQGPGTTRYHGTLKEDLLLWCMTRDCQLPFQKPSVHSRLGPPPAPASAGRATQSSDRATHTTDGKEICRKFNANKCTRGDQCIFAQGCWNSGCLGKHSAKACPAPSRLSSNT